MSDNSLYLQYAEAISEQLISQKVKTRDELLENMFNDKDTINWWLYECNYGRDFSLGDLEEDGRKIDLTTSEKLYDYLIKEMEKE